MTTVTRYTGVTATGTGPRLAFLKNLIYNPRALTDAGLNYSAGTGGAAVKSRPTTGGPLPEVPSFMRVTWNTAPTAIGSLQLYNGLVGANLITPGKTYIARAYVRASFAATIQPKVGWWNGASYVGGANGTGVLLAANTWTAVSMEATAPASGIDRVQMNTDLTSTSALPAVGSTVDATAWFVFEKPAGSTVETTTYGDGDMTGWTWLGTAHASASQGYGAIS